jgi:hypothetical protein
LVTSGLSPEPRCELLADNGDLPRTVRNQEDDEEEQYAEHRA